MKKLFLAIAFVFVASFATAQDMIPTDSVTFIGPDRAVATFPVTTAITAVTFTDSMNVAFTKKDGPNRWPDFPWGGPGDSLQYSIGFVLKVNGQWFASAPIENWFGRTNGTGPVQDQSITDPSIPSCRGQLQCHIFSDGRWNPMQTVRPAAGETIGVYVVAGDARNGNFPSVRERSNIVTLALPNTGETKTFTFGAILPLPIPDPIPLPVPSDPDPRIEALQIQMLDVLNRLAAVNDFAQSVANRVEAVNAALDSRVKVLEARTIPTSCSVRAIGVTFSCRLN